MLHRLISTRQAAVVFCFMLAILILVLPPPSSLKQSIYSLRRSQFERASSSLSPKAWLATNSDNQHAVTLISFSKAAFELSTRPRAALISLVRNSELDGIVSSMTQLEYRWNRKYQYPWIFFNEEPFSQEFIVRNAFLLINSKANANLQSATQNLTKADCYYEVIPKEHWSMPDWVDEGRFMNSLEYLGAIGVGKGWMISYRHMCRWNSGFFYKHPRLASFDYYWRVEPDVSTFSD
jgi:alpha 1,2-mannosyltransferase